MIADIDPVGAVRSMFALEFLRNAFIAGTFIALSAGLVGYFVVLRNQVFAADALSHVAFTGALASFAFGVDPVAGLFLTTTAGSVAVGALGSRARARDVVIGTVFAWVLGLGVLFLTLYTRLHSSSNSAAGVNVLFGSIYGLSSSQVAVATAVGAGVSVVVVLLARPLLFASVDPDVATARGLPVRFLGLAFMALLGITVAEAVQAIGALLIFGLTVIPAAAAQKLTARPFRGLAVSAAISVACLWGGLTLSHIFERLPPSFVIVALGCAVYVFTTIGGSVRQRMGRSPQRAATPTARMETG